MCWLPPRVTWQPTLPRCVLRDRPTISPVASLGVRSSTKNERHRFPKPSSAPPQQGRKGSSILPTKESSPGPLGALQFLSQPTRFFVQPIGAFAFSTVSLPLLL